MTIPPSVQRLLSMQKRWFNPDFDREFHAMLKMDRKAGSLCCWPMGFHWERLRDNDLPHPTLMEMLEASTITFELMADKALPIWCGRPESYSALALKAFLGEASSPGASPEACWAKYRERCAYIERLNGDAWRTARLAQRRWWYEDAA